MEYNKISDFFIFFFLVSTLSSGLLVSRQAALDSLPHHDLAKLWPSTGGPPPPLQQPEAWVLSQVAPSSSSALPGFQPSPNQASSNRPGQICYSPISISTSLLLLQTSPKSELCASPAPTARFIFHCLAFSFHSSFSHHLLLLNSYLPQRQPLLLPATIFFHLTCATRNPSPIPPYLQTTMSFPPPFISLIKTNPLNPHQLIKPTKLPSIPNNVKPTQNHGPPLPFDHW